MGSVESDFLKNHESKCLNSSRWIEQLVTMSRRGRSKRSKAGTMFRREVKQATFHDIELDL